MSGARELNRQRFVLIHSPVVGPRTWIPVASELTRLGAEALVPDLAGFADQGPPYAVRLIDLARAALPDAGPFVLVVHSGAGVFAPYLADTSSVIFVDASLPPLSGPHSGTPLVTDSEFLPFLRNLAVDGIVPPWPQWWPAGEVAGLVPDDQVRSQVLAEAQALPVAFFTEELPPEPPSWRSRKCGYLRFSRAYEDAASDAASRGWPVREMAGQHLHMVVEPAHVARALAGLASDIRVGGDGPLR
jgi:hypothetical protein